MRTENLQICKKFSYRYKHLGHDSAAAKSSAACRPFLEPFWSTFVSLFENLWLDLELLNYRLSNLSYISEVRLKQSCISTLIHSLTDYQNTISTSQRREVGSVCKETLKRNCKGPTKLLYISTYCLCKIHSVWWNSSFYVLTIKSFEYLIKNPQSSAKLWEKWKCRHKI